MTEFFSEAQMVISLRSKRLTRLAIWEEGEEEMTGSLAPQPRPPSPGPLARLQDYLLNELIVLHFDLHTHGHPGEPLEHILQTHHVPV